MIEACDRCIVYLHIANLVTAGGHLGRDKTYEKISSRFYWSALNQDVTDHIRQCDVCQRTNDAKFVKGSAALHPVAVEPKVWKQVIFSSSGLLTTCTLFLKDLPKLATSNATNCFQANLFFCMYRWVLIWLDHYQSQPEEIGA